MERKTLGEHQSPRGEKGDHYGGEDDDEGFIEVVARDVAEGKETETSNPRPGLLLDLGLAAKCAGTGEGTEEARISNRQSTTVTVVFDLPDGSQADEQFQLGQTVEVLKSYVEAEFGFPMADQALYLGSRLMMDPLSLLDYPEIDAREEVLIAVEGNMPAQSKK